MLAQCFYPECDAKLEYSCNCKQITVFSCHNHILLHKSEKGKHFLEDPYITVDSEILMKLLKSKKSALEELKMNIIESFEEFFKISMNNLSKMMDKIFSQEKTIEHYLQKLGLNPTRQIKEEWEFILKENNSK